LPVLSQSSQLIGVITKRQITNFLTSYKLTLDRPITKAIIKEFKKVDINDPLKYLSKAFNRHVHVLITSIEHEETKFFVTQESELLEYFLQNK
jgi:predicted transcriptional regulator